MLNKTAIGQEYFKRKIFRNIAKWFSEWIKQYPIEEINTMIQKNEFIVDQLEKELTSSISKDMVKKYLKEIELYKSSMTDEDKINLTKIIYFQLPEYREELSKNYDWLTEQVKQALIAFDSYIFKVKNDL